MELVTHNLIVISDLHLGGLHSGESDRGFEMCPPASRRRLARLIHRLAARLDFIPEGDSLELVINGDFVDFLAEEPFAPFTSSTAEAIEKLERIIRLSDEGSTQGERIFPALAEFLRRGNKLTVLLGNHDVELSLPSVRRALVNELTSGRPARLELIFDGEAYVTGDVLIEHGNRYDGWNAIEYGALRAYRSSSSRGEEPFQFQPPAGSRLVTSVMNPLKSRYRFVDLLKPENETVIPILCALEPRLAFELSKVAPLWLAMRGARGKPGRVRREESYIADIEPTSLSSPSAGTSNELTDPTEVVDNPGQERARLATEEVLKGARRLVQESLPSEMSERVPAEEAHIAEGMPVRISRSLGLWNVAQSENSRNKLRLLSRALFAHRQAIATTFDLSSKDPPYYTAAERLYTCAGARIVLFGHSHLAKAIPIADRGKYLNTGTWCATIRLPAEFYHDKADEGTLGRLSEFIEDLASNKIDRWTTLQTVFAHVQISPNGRSRAALCEVEADDRITVLWGEQS